MPTLNEVPEVTKLLATIVTGEPVTHGALAVIPLLTPNLDDPDWLTLEDLRVVALQSLGLPGDERRSQARRPAQRVEGMVQDLDSTVLYTKRERPSKLNSRSIGPRWILHNAKGGSAPCPR
jgi:hypothetical protein